MRVIIEWPSKEAALAFMGDPDYRPHLEARTAGSRSHHVLIEGFKMGANDYITKPVSKGELLVRLDAHLEAAGRTRDEIDIYISPNRSGVDRDMVDAYEAAGVAQLILPLFAGSLESLDGRIDALRKTTGMA